jgi:CheY-like chemotaxis protein
VDTNAEELEAKLDANGITTSGEVASGAEALDEVRRLEPDLVIIDGRLPGMDGAETSQRIKRLRHVPVIMLREQWSAVRAKELDDVDEVIDKSAAPRELERAILRVLERRKPSDPESDKAMDRAAFASIHDREKALVRMRNDLVERLELTDEFLDISRGLRDSGDAA